MRQLFVLRKQALRFYCKIKHRRGHGIHSPLVFAFVSDILSNKHAYYAYGDAERKLKNKKQRYRTTKTDKLVFKVVNAYGKQKVLCVGRATLIPSLYASLVSKQVQITAICPTLKGKQAHFPLVENICFANEAELGREKFDLVVADLSPKNGINGFNCKQFLERLGELTEPDGIAILLNIRTNATIYLLVRRVWSSNAVRISLDMYKQSVLFFSQKYHKQHYKLNY